MKATAKYNLNYNGVWYKPGDVFEAPDGDEGALAEYCEIEHAYVPFAEQIEPQGDERAKKRGRPKKTEE